MDALLIFIWFMIALGFLFSLIASSYFVYVRGAKPIDILSKFILALIVYGFLTFGSGFLAGLTLFMGAHSNPVGSILETKEIILGVILLFVYLAAAWLMCSFIVGSLIRPNWLNERFNRE